VSAAPWRRPPRWVVDWAPVALLPPVLVLDAVVSHSGKPLTALNVACAVLVCVPLALRRRLSVASLVTLVVAGVVLAMWLLHPGNTIVLVPMVAVYELARRFDRRQTLWIAAICVPGVLAGVLPFSTGLSHTASLIARNLALCLFSVAAGDSVRSRQEATERAADLREEETLRRVADERLRIAHEIHDVVAHGMTAINVQAGVAAHLLERRPDQAHRALRDIKRVSGDALAELRGALEDLRAPDGDPRPAPRTPAGRLTDLERLLDGVRAAGVATELRVEAVGEVPAVVHHATYRIVQEAVTNVARHSGAAHACVSVCRQDGAVLIEVSDDGHGAEGGADGSGNGLRGMRERARALGGTFEAGKRPDGGFTVRARVPVDEVVSGA
jgi:signal transduction histidine kinase